MLIASLPPITTKGYRTQMQQPLKERSHPSLTYTLTDIVSTQAWTKARNIHRQRARGSTSRAKNLATGQVVQRSKLLNLLLLSKMSSKTTKSVTWRLCRKNRLSKTSTKKPWTLTDWGWKQASTSRSCTRCRHTLTITSWGSRIQNQLRTQKCQHPSMLLMKRRWIQSASSIV